MDIHAGPKQAMSLRHSLTAKDSLIGKSSESASGSDSNSRTAPTPAPDDRFFSLLRHRFLQQPPACPASRFVSPCGTLQKGVDLLGIRCTPFWEKVYTFLKRGAHPVA